MTAQGHAPAELHTASVRLPVKGRLPSFGGATGWLINRLRQLPYLRAWAGKYSGRGLVVIGVHTPEFAFEHDLGNVRRAVREMRIDYTVATDNDYAVWSAFANHHWPALIAAIGAQGRIRHHHFVEGEYQQSEMVI